MICSAKLFQGFVLSDPSSKSCMCGAVEANWAVRRKKGFLVERGSYNFGCPVGAPGVRAFVRAVFVRVCFCLVLSSARACWRASLCFECTSMQSTYQ